MKYSYRGRKFYFVAFRGIMINWTAIILRNSYIDNMKCFENIDSFTDVSFSDKMQKLINLNIVYLMKDWENVISKISLLILIMMWNLKIKNNLQDWYDDQCKLIGIILENIRFTSFQWISIF